MKTILLDIKRCVGCEACTVACIDQNDLKINNKLDAWRRVFKFENRENTEELSVTFISHACMHCQEAPCIMACPTGAIYKHEELGIVNVDSNLCIGCHSCSLACPFGIPLFNEDGKMQKCNLCMERVHNNLEPACVHTCPTKALRYGRINELTNYIQNKYSKSITKTR